MRKAFCVIINLCVFLAGCAQSGTGLPNDVSIGFSGTSSFAASMSEDNRQNAKGRFVETDITPLGTEPFAIWLTDAGIVCQVGPRDLMLSTDAGDSWNLIDTGWMDSFEHGTAGIYHVESDATIWVRTDDPPLSAQLWRKLPNGSLQEIELEGVQASSSVIIEYTWDSNRLLARYAEMVSGSGGWKNRAGVFDSSSGELLYSIIPPEQYFRVVGTDFFALNNRSIYYIAPGGRSLSDLNATYYQISNGERLGEYRGIVPIQGVTTIEFEISVIESDQNNLYYINHFGLNRVALGGSLSEVVIETERYQFQGAGMQVSQLLLDSHDTFYILSRPDRDTPNKPSRIYKYSFDPDAPYLD